MSNRHDPEYPSRDYSSRESSREHAPRESRGAGSRFRDYPWREQGAPREYASREYDPRNDGSRESGDFGRSRDADRRDDRYWQTDRQREDDDTSSDYRAPRYSTDDRNDYRHPGGGRARQDNSRDPAAPFYAAGYSGNYGASPARESRRYPEHSWSGERHPHERGTYEERGWSRDSRSGEPQGYDYEARWPGSGAGSDAYHQPVRWRGETELGSREGRSTSRSGGTQESSRFGQYGKGPKGYVRSDERIREDVSDRLSDDDELDASDITVTVVSAEVRLEGTVLDRYSKHRAEDLAAAVSGVQDVSNNLRSRKGFFQEMGDKLSGDDKSEHRGHSGSGTHDAPQQSASQQSATQHGAPQQSAVSNSPPQNSPLANSTAQSPLQNSIKSGLSTNR